MIDPSMTWVVLTQTHLLPVKAMIVHGQVQSVQYQIQQSSSYTCTQALLELWLEWATHWKVQLQSLEALSNRSILAPGTLQIGLFQLSRIRMYRFLVQKFSKSWYSGTKSYKTDRGREITVRRQNDQVWINASAQVCLSFKLSESSFDMAYACTEHCCLQITGLGNAYSVLEPSLSNCQDITVALSIMVVKKLLLSLP